MGNLTEDLDRKTGATADGDPGFDGEAVSIRKLDGSLSGNGEPFARANPGPDTIDGDDSSLDTGSDEGASDLGEQPKRKPRAKRSDAGQPRGPKRRSKAQKEELDLIRQKVIAYHQIGAALAGVPEIALDEKEAEFLARDVLNVIEQYDIVIDPKTQAWISLAMTASAIYFPHYLVFIARKKAEREGLLRRAQGFDAGRERAFEGVPVN
jgi:hypothetical protein